MATLKIALYFYTPKKLQGGNPQCIKKHRSDTDSLYLYGAEMCIYLCNSVCGNMLSDRIIKMTDTLAFENISELVRNELRRSYLRLYVRVEMTLVAYL